MSVDNALLFVEELFKPYNSILDGIFYAGALYGANHLASFAWECMKGLRTYFIPFGRCAHRDLAKEFGKWAGVLG